MALLLLGLEDACPISANSGLDDILDLSTRYFTGLQAVATHVGTSTFGTQNVVVGDLSSRAINLRAYRSGGIISTGNRISTSVYIQPKNPAQKITIGAAMRINTAGVTGALSEAPRPLIGINEVIGLIPANATTMANFSPYCVMAREGGAISVGANKSDDNVLNGDTYRYVEAIFDPSDGSVDVYVDDVLAVSGTLSFSSVDKIGFVAGGGADGSGLGFGTSQYTLDIDNFYSLDDTGATFNTRLGPRSVQRVPLLAESAVTFSPVGAASNILAVNGADLDTDSFVRSPQADNQSDLYTVDSDVIDDTKDIDAVIIAPYFRKTALGARDLAGVATDGVNEVERVFTDADTTFKGSSTPLIMTTAPDGDPWTKAKIAACEFGYKVKA